MYKRQVVTASVIITNNRRRYFLAHTKRCRLVSTDWVNNDRIRKSDTVLTPSWLLTSKHFIALMTALQEEYSVLSAITKILPGYVNILSEEGKHSSYSTASWWWYSMFPYAAWRLYSQLETHTRLKHLLIQNLILELLHSGVRIVILHRFKHFKIVLTINKAV